ncbi:MAG: hypothetical protein ACR2PS_06030, partial [Pseudomonadales bacterium]
AHTEYDFSSQRVGFEVFRFEGDQTVEHWDNIQARKGPNTARYSMVDGPTQVSDPEKTEANRELVRAFIEEVVINNHFEKLSHYIDNECYIEHTPVLDDGLLVLTSALAQSNSIPDGDIKIRYDKLHRVLAEGSFVLSVSEGFTGGAHSSFYDLFRVADGNLVEHWNTTEAIPAPNEWKNDNGKF